MSDLLIRAFDQDGDALQVRDLFVQVNRELAPPHLRTEFERYIELARREEIDRIAEYYAGPNRGFWIGEDGAGALLGTYGLEPAEADAVELRRMYVAPAARRRGVARALLADALQRARAFGCARMVLSTSELQPAALAFYRNSGLTLVREERAESRSNKTVGGGLTRFHFETAL